VPEKYRKTISTLSYTSRCLDAAAKRPITKAALHGGFIRGELGGRRGLLLGRLLGAQCDEHAGGWCISGCGSDLEVPQIVWLVFCF
jgi:hypothetical protein